MKVDALGSNLPGGEFFGCPLENSAEGEISFAEFPAVYTAARCPESGSASTADASSTPPPPPTRSSCCRSRHRRGRARLGELGDRLQPGHHALHEEHALRREDRRHRAHRAREQLTRSLERRPPRRFCPRIPHKLDRRAAKETPRRFQATWLPGRQEDSSSSSLYAGNFGRAQNCRDADSAPATNFIGAPPEPRASPSSATAYEEPKLRTLAAALEATNIRIPTQRVLPARPWRPSILDSLRCSCLHADPPGFLALRHSDKDAGVSGGRSSDPHRR